MKEIPLNEKALGLIETRGLIGAVEAADAMVKAAKVKLHPAEYSTGALVVIKVTGEVGAVKAAVDAGAKAAEKAGHLISAHIIPRPHDDTENLIFPRSIPPGEDNPVDFSQMTVKQLRNYTRNMPGIELKGREISSANREILLKALKKVQTQNIVCRFPDTGAAY